MAIDGSRKAVLAALVANFGIAIAKFVAYAFTRSASMLAEGVHSVADTSNQALLLLGSSRAQKDPTPNHPFGFGRERYFWSFVVAMLLFSLGSLFALYEGIGKLRDPHELTSPIWAIAVLCVGLVLEGASFRTAVRAARPARGSASWARFIRQAKTPELPVVLLEDAGALIGLVLALVGVSLAALTGEPAFDAAGTIAIGALLGVIAVVLAIEMKSLLIGEAASEADQAAIKAALASTHGVEEVVSVRTQHFGPQQLLVVAQVDFVDALTAERVASATRAGQDAVRAAVPGAKWIYLESVAVEQPSA